MMNTTNDTLADTVQYLNLAVEHIKSNKTVGQTAKGVAKQAGFAVGGSVVGGVALGPLGALVGSVIGSGIGYAVSDNYDGALQRVLKMNDHEKAELVQQIRNAVGANPIASFYTWYSEPENAEAVNTLIVAAIGIAYATTGQKSISE